jgi:biopolymer transport protein ExbB
MMILSTIQDGSEVLTDGESVEKTLSIIELIGSGGTPGMIIITILFLLMIVAIYIYFERLFAIKEASKIDSNFMNQIKDHVSHGKIDSAQILCAQANSPVSRLINKGITRIGKPLEDMSRRRSALRWSARVSSRWRRRAFCCSNRGTS